MFREQLTRLEQIHSKGIIHRDVKPENFVIKNLGPKRKQVSEYERSKGNNDFVQPIQQVYLIDFGLGNYFRDPKTGSHIEERKKSHFLGTVGFSSINSHLLKEQSRRDDLEGLVYVLIYL